MAQQLKTDIILNLAGNLAAKARQYGTSMSDFAKKNDTAMTMIKRSTEVAGRGIDTLGNRYVGIAATLATGVAARNFAQVDRRLSRLAISADITRDKAKDLYDQIRLISNEKGIRIDPKEALSAVEEILTKTGDLEFAIKNLPNMAAVIQATGASGQNVGGIFTELKKLGISSSEEAMKAIDTLNKQGKSGAFTLASMANYGPQIFAAYAATGRQGAEAVTELGAALQVIREGSGSDAEAVTAFTSIIRDITNPDRAKKLKELGNINVFDPEKLKKGVEEMRSLPKLMTEIVVKSKANSQNLGLLQLTDEANRALNPLKAVYKQVGDVKVFDKFMNITSDGSETLKDSSIASDDFAASLQLLNNSLETFANSRLSKPIQDIADAINGVDQETIDNWLQWGETALWVVGGLVAAKKGLEVASDIKNVFGGKGKNGKGGAGGFADMGVMPVYVVNMGAGGMGGGITDVMGGKNTSANPTKTSRFFNRQTIATLGTVGLGFSMADEFSPVNIRRAGSVDPSLSKGVPVQPGLLDAIDDFKKWFSGAQNGDGASIVNNMNAVGSKLDLKIAVSDDRIKVTPVYVPKGISVDSDTGIN
ncbi:phage tail tape measure protein [Shewanella baltica]|uniref:phage tail tape measure protein n=1 Tax=Shewanella baltica TaxID=62322 RepID=UPI003D79E289